MPGRQVLGLDPADPLGREAAGGRVRFHDLLAEILQLGPGFRRRVGIKARFFKHGLVVIHDRGRTVEGQRQHIAVGVGVIADHGRQIGRGIEGHLIIRHQLVDRDNGALGGHHRAGADFEHLDDGRLLLRTERGDRGRHRFGIGTLIGRHDRVFVLRVVEALGDFFQLGAQFAAHGVPPLDFGLRIRRRQRRDQRHGGRCENSAHDFLPLWSCGSRTGPNGPW